MKPTQLIITNIGKLAGKQVIDINKPLILFYGEIKQGKSTILNCVRWVCGGEFPDDIITHGEKEGGIEFYFDGGMIARTFYRSKTGETKARAVVMVKSGKPVPSPVAEIKRLLNPFLLDQDFLRNKTELERKQYFTELFAVDTTEMDTELFNSQREAQSLRAKIAGYGEINLTKSDPVDVSVMRSELKGIQLTHQNAMTQWQQTCRDIDSNHGKSLAEYTAANAIIQTHNTTVEQGTQSLAETRRQIAILRAQLTECERKEKETDAWLKANLSRKSGEIPIRPANPEQPAPTDTTALDSKIQEAGATNVRAEQYAANKARATIKATDEKSLSAMEKRQRDIKTEKMAKLKSIGDTCGIEGLSFDDAGNFVYQDTTAGMISDSQIMRLSSELSALYPEGFGLDLIDRAESLGKSIFEFVDRAKAEKKSIMATIVGECPAKVPLEIGVWVVDNGSIVEKE